MPPTRSTATFPGLLAMLPSEDAARTPMQISAQAAPKVSTELRALTLAIRAGDAAAFASFYNQYHLRIYKHLLALAQGDEAVAREVFQTVAIKIARKLEVFEREPVLLAWLRQVARNAFLDHCRAHRRHRHLVAINEATGDVASAAPEDHLRGLLADALAECAPDEREWLNAVYVDGKTIGEVAAEHGQTGKALEARLARLRQKLRRAISKPDSAS